MYLCDIAIPPWTDPEEKQWNEAVARYIWVSSFQCVSKLYTLCVTIGRFDLFQAYGISMGTVIPSHCLKLFAGAFVAFHLFDPVVVDIVITAVVTDIFTTYTPHSMSLESLALSFTFFETN